MLGGPGAHRHQVDVTIRDVHGEDAVGLQMLEVQLEGLVGQQVRRDRVAGERIDGQQVELLWRLSFQCQPGVAEQDVEIRAAASGAGQERELSIGNGDDVRVDFIQPHVIAVANVA